jgi:AraC-like DNA-binding protein/DNA-binding NarL/FixJ family response regulator
MVVEDSKPILRNLAQQIESVDCRVRVVAIAANGKEALTRLRGVKVDIVFSDIKMPVMSGLDFLSEARSRFPALRCVIISGYDDFEFARQAIQIGVNEYILKPVATDELRSVLNKIIASLDGEKKQVFEAELSRALKRGDIGWRAPEDVLRGPYGACLVRAGAVRDGSIALDQEEIHVRFKEAGAREGSLFFVETRWHSERAVVCDLDALAEDAWQGICSRVHEAMVRRGQVARMAWSRGCGDVTGLPLHIASLSQCLEEHVYLDKPTLVWADRIPGDQDRAVARNELARFREEASLIAGGQSLDEFRRRVEEFVSLWRARDLPLIVVRKLLGVLVDALNERANDASLAEDSANGIDELLGRSGSYETLVNELCRLYQDTVQQRKEGGSPSEGIVPAAVEMFRRNINRNITMHEIAARLGYSLSYVHRVLRLALGKAPMEYFNDMKLDEAKRLLERYPDMKIKEIARSLGFQDQHYFSRAFKTHVSLSPLEYRQQLKQVP